MKIAVVGLGKIGLPLAVQFAGRGHHVVGADVDDRTSSRPSTRAASRSPARRPRRDGSPSVVRSGAVCGRRPTTPTAVPASDAVVVVVPLFVDAEGVPDFGWMDAATADIAAGLQPGHPRVLRDDAAGRHHPQPARRRCWRRRRPARRAATSRRLQPGAGARPAGSSPTCARYPKLVGGVDESAAARRSRSTSAVLDFDERPDLRAAQRRVGPGLGRGRGAGQAGRDDLPRRQHRPGQPVRACTPTASGIDVYAGDRGLQHPALQPHPPARHRRRRPLHPGLPADVPVGDPEATVVRAAREANAAMPELRGRRCWPTPTAT